MAPTPNLLEGQAISKTFPIEGGIFRHRIGSVQALKAVSFHIAKGDTLALVGGSGCGKSTLAKIITGLTPADEGTLLWEGQPFTGVSRVDRAKRIQMIFQDPFASLNPKLSIGTQLNDVLRVAGQGDAGQLLDAVGLPREALTHYPFQFSGGQRQRVAIARALAMRPQLLIADEPLSALDVTLQASILQLLRDLKKSYELTILFISHDLAVVEQFAERVIVLQNGEVAEQGAVATLLTHPQHAYTRALLDAVPRIQL